MALKHIALKLRCFWHGHEATFGNRWSVARNRYIDCLVCKHCLKVL